jgi:DNA-binding transcriptional LysR family regulator
MEQLDLKYLQYALAVARCGSVTQAARELYLAQPNLSRAVAELEQALGFPLFIRTHQGMTLTARGERFLTEAEGMLDRLSILARECRQAETRLAHIACVPSSLFVNSVLEAARRMPELIVQCEEYYSCLELFDRVVKGASQAAFLTFGAEMKDDLLAYLLRRELNYHPLAQSPAYGVVRRSSGLYHPETDPPLIRYDQARLMLSVTYFDPIGIHFHPEKAALPRSRGVCHGVGRAGNLDMLESIDDLVMISCHVHSKITARNELAAVPIQPERMAYEYGYVTGGRADLDAPLQALLAEVRREVGRELGQVWPGSAAAFEPQNTPPPG